jgi:tetratricopeptide (TPR) repeat protein
MESNRPTSAPPFNAEGWHSLGCEYERLRMIDEAARCYREAVQLNPRADGSYNNLGNCLQALGRFEEAQTAYRSAIALTPGRALYYRNLVQATQLTADDPCFVSLEQQLAHAGSMPPHDRAELHFALGQALSGMGQSERGFDHLLQAASLKRGTIQYDEAETFGLFSLLSRYFTRQVFCEKRGLGDPSVSPIFIVGMPRCGSTLVEQILSSHPQVLGAGEVPEFGQALLNALTQPGKDHAGVIRLDALNEASAAQLTAFGADYVQRIARLTRDGGQHARIADKYLYNFINVGFIHLALPNARIIHVRRGPVDTCLSIFGRPFGDVSFAYDLGELGRYYRAYDALMAHWRSVLPQGAMLEVQYEDLVDDFEANVRRMIEYCGLEWDARCLAFHENRRAVDTASAAQVRKPLFRSSITRWRPARALLAPLYEGLGPELAA